MIKKKLFSPLIIVNCALVEFAKLLHCACDRITPAMMFSATSVPLLWFPHTCWNVISEFRSAKLLLHYKAERRRNKQVKWLNKLRKHEKMCVCVKFHSERNSVCHEVRCWDERGRRRKTLWSFPVFPSCPESILPVWPQAGEGQTMKWGRTRGSPHRFRHCSLPTLFCFSSQWK